MEENINVRKGAWTVEEDDVLRAYVEQHGEGNWHLVPGTTGLNRCRKSCRRRWLDYLKPGLKKGKLEEGEVDLVEKMHRLLGNRWSLIAGRIPGRTSNDIKNYWNTNHVKRVRSSAKQKCADLNSIKKTPTETLLENRGKQQVEDELPPLTEEDELYLSSLLSDGGWEAFMSEIMGDSSGADKEKDN